MKPVDRAGEDLDIRLIYDFAGSGDRSTIGHWRVEAWANVNPPGAYHRDHHHIRNHNIFSGVYYVDMGGVQDDQHSARVGFYDIHAPFPRSSVQPAPESWITPHEGMLLLFSSGLGHRVEPHSGNRPRITVAFNLKNEHWTTAQYEEHERQRRENDLSLEKQ